MNNQIVKDEMLNLLSTCKFHAEDAMKHYRNHTFNEGIPYLNSAISNMNTAKTFYFMNVSYYEDEYLETVFSNFTIFYKRFLTDCSKDHSPQQSQVIYENFIRSYEKWYSHLFG